MIKIKFLAALSFLVLLNGCKTDDVVIPDLGPMASLSTTANVISEDGGSAQVSVSLSSNANTEITVVLKLGGTATLNEDFSISTTTVVFAPGDVVKTVLLTALQDTLEEGNETIEISIASAAGAQFNPAEILTIIIEDDDVAPQVQLILNEILYDPSNNGLDGDANGDGRYAQNEDEFVEFINLSSQPLDVSGYKIFDTSALNSGVPRHVVPQGTVIPPGKALVVFGGGTPTGSFGGAIVQTSTTGDLNLNNAGDIMTLQDNNGNILIQFDIEPLSDNPNEAYTRNPDLTGDFVRHLTINSSRFSPGTRVDGSPF